MLQFYSQNELISNLMPATGLKIVGTRACLPWCSISSSFQNSLKTSGHRGYEFLEFCCWNLVPFLPDIGFLLQAGQFSTRTLLLRSNAVVIAAEIHKAFPEIDVVWTGAYVALIIPFSIHMALFHCVVRLGSARSRTARHGSVRLGLRFHCSLVPL